MEGTRPDGDVKTLAGEQLVVDAELGHLFDYYLAGLGEKTSTRSGLRSNGNLIAA